MSVCGPKCSGCSFEHKGTIFIPPDGTGSNGVLIVGDSGWNWEAATLRACSEWGFPRKGEVGTPFSGPSGWFMDAQFERLRVKRSDFKIANGIWCKAPALGMTDNPDKFPEAAAAIEHCHPYLDELVAEMQPRVIVPLGSAALHRVTGLHGIERHHAYTLLSSYKNLAGQHIPAIPAFHPSYIMQGQQKFAGCFMFVIDKALKIARGEAPAEEATRLLLDPPIPEAWAFIEGWDKQYVAADIETAESPTLGEDELMDVSWKIVRISFGFSRGCAISVPFAPPYLEFIAHVLGHAHHLIFWNQNFDVPRLRAVGMTINGIVLDAMWAWHFLQSDLPKALGFAAPLLLNVAPWKHLNHAEPAYYNALDSCYTFAAFEEIKKLLDKEGRWAEFQRQCTDMLPIMQGMTDGGLLIDTAKQSQFLDIDLPRERDEMFAQMQSLIPRTINRVKVYKKQPKGDLTPRMEKDNKGRWKVRGGVFQPNNDGVAGGTLVLPFNPGSSPQRKDLFRALGLPIPRDRGDKETIAKKHLHRYAKKYPVLKLIEEFGERQKLITSYDWPIQPDGRIHPIFGFNPSTWRKNASDPNIQTIPKRNDLAQKFRELLVAAPGHVLIEIDSSAIEAVLVGFFAHSDRYIALAKKGVHKWLAEQFAGRPVSKEEPLYDKIKRVVHLSNYLGSPRRIADEYPDDFPSWREAEKLQNFYFETDAGRDVRAWQSQTLALANYQHFLDTPFKQRHYFYDVLQSDGKLGTDAKRSIAFMPQATASALQTLFIQRIPEKWRDYLPESQYRIRFIKAIIHDSIVAEVPVHFVDSFAHDLYRAMTDPIAELNGLSIGAEAKEGFNLGDMKKLTLY